jgi:uncharacterized membrane protein YgdD (TMEM256/DUF423 family)
MTPFALCLLAGSLLGALGVGLGALGAHALQERIPETALASFKTGVLYQMLHALALLSLAAIAAGKPSIAIRPTAALWILGILLFSGSIYLLSLRSLLGIEHWRWLGPVTPLGGLLLIAGWITLALQAFNNPT